MEIKDWETNVFELLEQLVFEKEQHSIYKIGSQVKLKKDSETYFIIGLKTVKSDFIKDAVPIKQVILHKNKDVPTRLGFAVFLNECVLVGG